MFYHKKMATSLSRYLSKTLKYAYIEMGKNNKKIENFD